MILVGQYDSPFVRRVGIALTLYGLPFEHKPWSVFGDADKIRPYNPLVRVPTLVLGTGDVLIESHSILDYLDSLVPFGAALFPASEPERRQALKISALATGVAEKAVSLFYEMRLHTDVSKVWIDRCHSQILATLAVLETESLKRTSEHWLGERLGHADIAVAVTLRFILEAHPHLIEMANYPSLDAHCARLENMPVFKAVMQPFLAPS
jgi:glutathione S-transferase